MDAKHNLHILRDRRRELRKRSTSQEDKLWNEIRNDKLGVKFKRQHSIGGYIADFYCRKHELIIEVDGEIHNTRDVIENDKVRDKYFTNLGYKIVRFSNVEIDSDIKKVLAKIKFEMKS